MILGRFHHPWYGRAMPLSAHAINTTVKYPWCFCLLLALVGGRCCCVMKLNLRGGRSAHSGDPGVTTAGHQSAYFHLSLWSRFRGAQASEGVTSVWVYVYVYIQLQEKVSEPFGMAWISALITIAISKPQF